MQGFPQSTLLQKNRAKNILFQHNFKRTVFNDNKTATSCGESEKLQKLFIVG